jgi:N-acetylneuraminate synthase
MLTPKVVAEIGCNHMGNLEIAHEMIEAVASFSKADYVKFQKRSNQELLTTEEYTAPHPVPENSFGSSYGEHREFLEFSVDEHRQLMSWCRKFGIEYSTSVWDLTSAKEIVALEPKIIKIPSACNLNKALLQYLAVNYRGGIHISLGMTTPEEQREIVDHLDRSGALNRVVLYACTSGYPVPHEDICLLEIKRLKEEFGQSVDSIGFSGHHLGIAADIAAITLGAAWVERHFTMDRTWKGTDHAASLEPDGLRRLVRDVRAVSKALSFKDGPLLDIEEKQRDKLKRVPGKHFDQ